MSANLIQTAKTGLILQGHPEKELLLITEAILQGPKDQL